MKFPYIILLFALVVSVIPVAAMDSSESLQAAGALYSSSVDLANAGKYQEALDAADKALAMNVTSMTAIIQSNRAGILVMLHRDGEAIAAADTAIAVEGNLTSAHSIAWYNKGNALRALGRIPEARDAYNHAYALDNTLTPPDMSGDVTLASAATPAGTQAPAGTPAPRSPVNGIAIFVALGIAAAAATACRKP